MYSTSFWLVMGLLLGSLQSHAEVSVPGSMGTRLFLLFGRSLGLNAFCFFLLAAGAVRAQSLVDIEMVYVGDAGNPHDTTGFGAVNYAYQIGKYEVTINQYAVFLNAKAQTDPYGLWNANMQNNLNVAGISRSGSAGSYVYSVMNNAGLSGNRPISYVSWFDAARFINWMHNGGTGAASTETGVYTLHGITGGDAPKRNAGAAFWLPTANEWYKAAYYKGGNTNAGYWDYATQSNTAPGNLLGSDPNEANYRAANRYAVTQSTGLSSTANYLTEVGTFSGSPSAYGTFDQTGNLLEWNDGTGAASQFKYQRGGTWAWTNTYATSSYSSAIGPTAETDTAGFRIATVPEPTVALLVLFAVGVLFKTRLSRQA